MRIHLVLLSSHILVFANLFYLHAAGGNANINVTCR